MDCTAAGLSDAEQFLSPPRLNLLRWIYLIHAITPVLFFVIIGAILSGSITKFSSPEASIQIMDLFSLVTFVLCGCSFIIIAILKRKQHRNASGVWAQPSIPPDQANAEQIFGLRYRSFLLRSMIILALLEMPALFGLISFLIAVINRDTLMVSHYVLNLLPTGVLAGYVILAFPNRDRLLSVLTHP